MLKPNIPPRLEQHIAQTMAAIRFQGELYAQNPNVAIVAHFAIQEVLKYADIGYEWKLTNHLWQTFEDEAEARLAQLTCQ